MKNYIRTIERFELDNFMNDIGFILESCSFYADHIDVSLNEIVDEISMRKSKIKFSLYSYTVESYPYPISINSDQKKYIKELETHWRNFLNKLFGEEYSKDLEAYFNSLNTTVG